jgi:hypothetical protein
LQLNSLVVSKHWLDYDYPEYEIKSRKAVLRLPLCAAVEQSMQQQLRIHDKVG